ncbi:serine protease, partial [Tulasnella sp. 408]
KLQDARAEYAATGKTSHKGSVVNMSLGGGKSQALDDAINKAADSGLHFAVAAGNDNTDACTTSPAAADKAITVGASTLSDSRASFSNHGPCVDVFAPGLNILSTWNTGNTVTNTISGTSMASPHVAGLLAYLLSIYPSATFGPEIKAALIPESAKQPLTGFAAVANSGFYAAVHANLPSWVSHFLPSPISFLAKDELAPLPAVLTPAQLKMAIIALSSPDLLSDIPKDTVNRLIFNNATELKFSKNGGEGDRT